MIVLGIILLVIGLVVPTLYTLAVIGGVVIVIGVILALLGRVGRPVGGRKFWW